MKSRTDRHKAILKIVEHQAVSTQGELRNLLKTRGFRVDQATVSRDIRELGLVKTSPDGSTPRYATVESVSPPAHMRANAIISRLVRGVEASGNLLVIKTGPGESSPVGLALDRLGWREIIGTVAGDDTLLVVVREGSSTRRLGRRILNLKTGKRDTA